ncbi:S-layer homology domain-containing protein [Paenibacillus sp. NPDC057934]|uniref:S-layer homology domain-containing protein n=1 Tax=Paenibacillus sp. NPDC057934 TaxID=3346282 RepID=UPI0036DDE24F
MYKQTSRVLAALLSASMILGSVAFAAAPAETTDIDKQSQVTWSDTKGHWAKEAIERWSARGIVNGTAANKFEPERAVTRSEWVALLNRIFQPQLGKKTAFKDVSEDKWFATDVSTAVYGAYIQGFPDGTFRPAATLSRAEAAVSITRLLKLPAAVSGVSFADQADIKDWGKDAINAVVEQGILTGYGNHTFQPNKALTRAEAVALADRAVNYYGDWYGEAGTYGPAIGLSQVKGNVIINAPGVSLKNTEINGNLIIGKGVGAGDVYLNNIKVKGEVFIYGGGENSIHLKDSVLIKIIVDKKESSVRLVAEGNSTVQEITMNTGAILDVSQGVSINRVSLTENMPPNSTVSLKGHFNTVNVEAYGITLKIPSGSVKELNMAKQGGGSTLEISKESSILSLVLNASTKVTGLGSIQNSIVNALGISFENKPENLTLGSSVPADLTVSIGGATGATLAPKASSTPAPVTTQVPVQAVGGGSGGGGTGGTGGGSESRPTAVPTEGSTPTPVPTATPVATSTPTSSPTPVSTATPTPANTETPVSTATPKPPSTPIPSATPASTATPVASATPLPEWTPYPSPSAIPSSMPTYEPTPTPAPSPTPAATLAPDPTRTPYPQPDDFIQLDKRHVGVGEAVYFTTDRDYDLYLIRAWVSYDKDSLEQAVQNGEAMKKHVKAGERNYFDTSSLKNVGFPQNHQFNIIAYDGNRYQGYVWLTILNESEPLLDKPDVFPYPGYPEYQVRFYYNRSVYLAEGQSLESIVQFRENNGEFKSFTSASGRVQIIGNEVYIRTVRGLLEYNNFYDFKLIAGAVTTASGDKNVEFISSHHTRAIRLDLLSPRPPLGETRAKAKAGDMLTFTIDAPGTVYMVPFAESGPQADYDKIVKENQGLKMEVDASKVNQYVRLQVTSLPPGDYYLGTRYGLGTIITVEE